jgi:hypothetical protein
MTRARIIADLMSALESITTAGGFGLDVREVRRGIHLAEELNELPALTLFNERVESADQAGGVAERTLVLHVWGAAPAAHGDYAVLDALAAAAVSALGDPALNPHWQATACGPLEVYEGGAGDPLGLFDLEVRVGYESPLDSL